MPIDSVLVRAVLDRIPLPFSAGLVEGTTYIGRGWPLLFERGPAGGLLVTNRGSLLVHVHLDGDAWDVAPGDTQTLNPDSGAADAP